MARRAHKVNTVEDCEISKRRKANEEAIEKRKYKKKDKVLASIFSLLLLCTLFMTMQSY